MTDQAPEASAPAKAPRKPLYGGQAVLEGVMMRGPLACAVAVRAPDQTIIVEYPRGRGLSRRRSAQIPFLRGLFVLVDSLDLGMRALAISANVQAGEDEPIEGAPLALAFAFSLLFAVGLFFLLPAGLAYLGERLFHWSPWAMNLGEGVIRLTIFTAYLAALGFVPSLRRVYGYHGAEHMTIHAFEAGAPLDVPSVSRFPREHPRCGTAFLLTVVILSVVVFSLLGPMPLGVRLLSRVLMVPVLAMFGYEYIRLTARLAHWRLARLIALPNLALQKLTTREPEEKMVEVAIAAFQAMRSAETAPSPSP